MTSTPGLCQPRVTEAWPSTSNQSSSRSRKLLSQKSTGAAGSLCSTLPPLDKNKNLSSGSLFITGPSSSLRVRDRRGISHIQLISVATCVKHVTCVAAVWVVFSPLLQTTAQQHSGVSVTAARTQSSAAGVKEPGISEVSRLFLQFPDCLDPSEVTEFVVHTHLKKHG